MLLSFNLTNSSLVVLHRGRSADGHQAEDRICSSPSRRRSFLSLLLPSFFSFTQYSHILPPASPSSQYTFLSKYKCEALLIIYHVFCIILASLLASAVSPSYDPLMEDSGRMIGIILSVSIFALLASLAAYNISLLPENSDPHSDKQFRVSYMPWPPLIGILFNYCLIALLTWIGLICLVIYFSTAALYYSLYCLRRADSVSCRHYLACQGGDEKASDIDLAHLHGGGANSTKDDTDILHRQRALAHDGEDCKEDTLTDQSTHLIGIEPFPSYHYKSRHPATTAKPSGSGDSPTEPLRARDNNKDSKSDEHDTVTSPFW